MSKYRKEMDTKMIFSDDFLQIIRETGINSANLRSMILLVAVKCSELEKELGINDGNNTKGHQTRSDATS